MRYETDATRGATFAVVSPAEDGAYAFPPMRFQLPADLGGLSFATARVADGQLRVSWTAVQGAAGYDLFFGPAGGAMARVEAGSATAWTLPAPESEDDIAARIGMELHALMLDAEDEEDDTDEDGEELITSALFGSPAVYERAEA
ncbi:MAG: hypothetical protein IIY83_00190, partial [Lachnospiraceae bacterium]|nr:hypothetical protein [Lachnospiraceae bacterium]